MKVLNQKNKRKTILSYVPHGIDSDKFKPVDKIPDDFLKTVRENKDYDFVIFWSNRNIRRKQPMDVIHSYKLFCDKLSRDKSEKCLLIMHTSPIDQNGTNLYEAKEAICPEYDVKFSASKLNEESLNMLYNFADITINIAGNEGFGLTTAESLMAGTPLIVNVTGGLQDQCGFKLDGKYLTHEDYVQIGSLHDWRKWKDNPKLSWGTWVIPVWSRVRSLTGSVATPYIYDDKVDVEEVADAIMKWYETPKSLRDEFGKEGREWMLTDGKLNSSYMCQSMVESIDETLNAFEPKQRVNIIQVK